jgi:hypothetical protein
MADSKDNAEGLRMLLVKVCNPRQGKRPLSKIDLKNNERRNYCILLNHQVKNCGSERTDGRRGLQGMSGAFRMATRGFIIANMAYCLNWITFRQELSGNLDSMLRVKLTCQAKEPGTIKIEIIFTEIVLLKLCYKMVMVYNVFKLDIKTVPQFWLFIKREIAN